jgi:hypothetical protein
MAKETLTLTLIAVAAQGNARGLHDCLEANSRKISSQPGQPSQPRYIVHLFEVQI